MGMGTIMGSIMFLHTMIQQFVLYHLYDYLALYIRQIIAFTNPYIEISFDEFTGEHFKLSKGYAAIEAYLSPKTSKLGKRLKAKIGKGNKNLVLSMADYKEIADQF
ncbi:AAA-type ATPase [Macleaya cordata]|uniref:AAA-type ATPase n=1 Tax=Macleaya cordata TaxID=56857 RepID=A0A200Q6M5_MACCD|nr:AAA-type ATPase [Macleaya cordata]